MSPKPFTIHRRARRVDPIVESPAAVEPGPKALPAPGSTAPGVSAGKVCGTCGAYAVNPDLHAEYHRRMDSWARRINDIASIVLHVFHARGYLPADENTTPSSGSTANAATHADE
ncbi:hypothetical protein [Nocardia africana]|uniref:Uncharacterized protein n=1 Tax=Nocardia africana TaxID=134964 RepID=A0A378X2J6_9NOCA|nr:hypothetical protein [Nocardia africana]MCC3311491.1 hypothetical protein [Nocardia africana]SUA47247.1 Uncharacterised protein [Nocardia africana]